MKNTFIILLLILLISCNQSNNQEKPAGLASINNQTILVEDFNQYILSLPVNQRWPLENTKPWLISSLKKYAVNQQLVSESSLIGIDKQPEYLQKSHEIKRVLYSNQYINSQAKVYNVTEEAIQQFYDEHNEIFNLPEKRTVRHIYKSFKDSKEQTINEITELRERVINGENFSILASEYSDSESRHNDGIIGTVKKGELSSDFDEIIFNLTKDIPSELVYTKTGIHVFIVDSILANKVFSIESVKSMILQQINMVETIKIIKEITENLPDTVILEIPSKKELESIYLSGKNPVILEIGDFSLTIKQFKQNLEEVQANLGIIQINDLPTIVIQDIAYREIIYQYMIKNQIALIDTTNLKSQTDQILIELMGNYKMKSFLNRNPEIINDYYKQNSMRFATPAMVDIELLNIPKENGINLMSSLENSAIELNQGETNFQELTEKYKGKIIKLGAKNAFQLSKLNNKILNFAFKLKKGQYSNPFTSHNSYNILKIVNIIEPKEQPLIAIRNDLINEYLKSNSASLYNKVITELIENLTINDQAVEQFILDSKRL